MSQRKSDKEVEEAVHHSDHPLEDPRLVADESDLSSDAAAGVSPSDVASESALTAARSIGGHKGHVTRLLQQLTSLISRKDFSLASEALELQRQLKSAHEKYALAVREFCSTVGEESARYGEYMGQLQTRDAELKNMDVLVNAFMLETLAIRSDVASSGSSRTSKAKSRRSGSASVRTSSTVSSASKARMDARLAEIRLKKAQQEQAIKAKALEADQAKALLESQREVLQAESELAEARVRLETVEEIPDLEVLEPALSIQDKVTDYLDGLNPSEGGPRLQDVAATSNAEATQTTTPCDFSQAEPVQVASSHLVPSTQTLNPLASPWMGNPGFEAVASKSSTVSHTGSVQIDCDVPAEVSGSMPLRSSVGPIVSVRSGSSQGPASSRDVAALADMFPSLMNARKSSRVAPVVTSNHVVPSLSVDEFSVPKVSSPCQVAVSHGPANAALVSSSMSTQRSTQMNDTCRVSWALGPIPPGSLPLHHAKNSLHLPSPYPRVPNPNKAISNEELKTTKDCGAVSRVNDVLHSTDVIGSSVNVKPSASYCASSPRPFSVQGPADASVVASAEAGTADPLHEFARVFVRCQGSQALEESEKFNGNPLQYHLFMRQVQDRIISIHGQSDPGHALQLLLNSTSGQAKRLISSCIMLPPASALQEALRLLFKAFGSPAVAIKAHLRSVCEGPPIHTDEKGLQDFYADLVNCKMVVESSDAGHLLDATSTAEGIFSRFPRNQQEEFAKLALRRGYDMEVVPFDLFIEFIEQLQRLATSRLGRLIKNRKETSSRNSGWSKFKPARAHAVHNVEGKGNVNSKPSRELETSKDSGNSSKCPSCGAPDHHIWRCQKFAKVSLKDRKALVRQKHLCFNCLGSGHGVKNCPSKSRCRTCAGTHHSLLHSVPPSEQTSPGSSRHSEDTSQENGISPQKSSDAVGSLLIDNPQVASTTQSNGARNRLQVLPVSIVNPSTGASRNCWALLDTGSDTHFLTHRLYSELGLDGQPIQSRLQLADGGLKTSQTFESTCVIQDIVGNHSFQLESVRVVDRLPDLSGSIPSTSDALRHEHLSGIELPVIEGNRVELLIGTGAPELHVFSEVRQGGDHGLGAGKTPLGWVLFGHDPVDYTNAVVSRHDEISQVHLVTTHALEPLSEAVCPCQLEFIDLTQDCDGCLPSLDDEKALDQMETSCRWEDGHYTIRLPWRDGCPNLPNNYPVALSRLKSLGRRLLREPEIRTKSMR